MKCLPIGITGDLHLNEFPAYARDANGYNSRLIDGVSVMLQIAGKAKKAGARTIIFAGDWFHSRKHVSVAVLHKSAELLNGLKVMGVGVILVPGNHDFSQDGLSLSVLGQNFVEVWRNSGVYEADGWKIGAIPWTDDPKVVRGVLDKKCDFYVGHFGVMGAKVGPSDFEIPGHITASDLSRVSKGPLFLSHYHKPQTIPVVNAHYLGSPLQLNWGEAGDKKRFVIMRPGGKFESIPLDTSPRFMRVTTDQLGRCRPNDFVEIVEDDERIERTREAIKKTHPTAKVVPKEKPEEEGVTQLSLTGGDVGDQLRAWVKHAPLPKGVKRKKAVRVASELMGG